MPIGRQGFLHIPGGHLTNGTNGKGPIEIALVADEELGAAEALGGLPMILGSVVIVWRCISEEAQRHERSGRFDCIVYCEAGEDRSAKAALHNLP